MALLLLLTSPPRTLRAVRGGSAAGPSHSRQFGLIPGVVAIGGIADIVQHWHEMARSRMTQSRHQPRRYIVFFRLNVISADPANLENICSNQDNTALHHAERLSCGGRYVKDAPFVKRTAIIDNYDYAAISFRVSNANASPKRQCFMRRSKASAPAWVISAEAGKAVLRRLRLSICSSQQ